MRWLFPNRSSKAASSGRGEGCGPRGAPGKRCYAIGDVHGRLDLLEEMLAKIEADHRSRPRKDAVIVMIGDLIDRGPDSRGVVERLLTRPPEFAELYCLTGNHEESLVRALTGEAARRLPGWLKHGGYECARSYGAPVGSFLGRDISYVEHALLDAIPRAHIDFMAGFADSLRFGDYLFVHAGIRPGVPLAAQHASDLRWIRDDFLSSGLDHGVMVVHGHTISERVQEKANRIGIDTGAYKTGVLSAIRIEDDERDVLQAVGASPARRHD
jgi:serine/threonine protein phosphatase 1